MDHRKKGGLRLIHRLGQLRHNEMTVAQNIRKAREAKGFTQEEAAARCGISLSMLKKYESGANLPTADKIANLASGLGVSAEIIFETDQTICTRRIGRPLQRNNPAPRARSGRDKACPERSLDDPSPAAHVTPESPP
ncbi:helix-turn-helix domain-containing protein [Pseudomonas aeruginosa]